MANDKKTKKAPQKKLYGGFAGMQAVEAVIFHFRVALFHSNAGNTELAQKHTERADEIFNLLPPDRKSAVNMVRSYLRPFEPTKPELMTEFVEYRVPTKPGSTAKFVSVPLTPAELVLFKELATKSSYGNMAGYAAQLIREEMQRAGVAKQLAA